MAVNETTTKFKVDISELKKGIQDANRQIKLANAEFKAASAGMDDWSKSADGVSAKIAQTDKVLTAQRTILADYQKQLALIEKEYGKNSKEADEMRIKVENQRAAVIKSEKSLDTYAKQLVQLQSAGQKAADSAGKQSTAYSELQSKVKAQENALESLKKEYASAVLESGKYSNSAKDLAAQISDLSADLKKNKDALEDADGAADEFDKSLDDLSETSESTGSGFTVLKGVIVDLVSNGIKMAAGAIKDFAKQTIEAGQNFEKSMSNVAALSGATGDELEMLRETAKKYGSTTQFSATQAADALGYMALAGWDAETSAKALEGVLNLAAASGMDLAEASDMVTDYMSAFNLEAEQSAYFADLLAYAQSHANTTAAGLGEAFKNCAANMTAAGQDVETTTALLSMLANQGLKGSEAGTALTAVMRDMTSKMDNGAIAIGETSVQVSDAEGNFRDLTDILFDVEAATQGMGAAEKATALQSTFTSDSIKGLNLILNAGVQSAANFESDLRGASVSLSGFEKAAKDTGVPLDKLKKELDKAGLSSEDFSEAVGMSEGSAELLVETLDEWMPAGKRAGEILKTVGISVDDLQKVMDESAGSAESMSKVMNDNLAGDMTALGSKVEGVQIALYEYFQPALRKGAEMVGNFVDYVGENLPAIVDWFEGAFNKVAPLVEGVFNLLKPIVSKGVAVIKPIISGIGKAIDAILPVVTDAVNWLNKNLPLVKDILIGIGAAVAAYLAYTTAILVAEKGWMALTVAQKAAAIAQKALAAGQKVLNAVMSANPIGLVIAAITALVAAFIILWKKSKAFREFWIGLWNKIKSVAEKAWEKIKGFFTGAFAVVKAVWSAAIGFFKGIWDGIKKVFNAVVDFFRRIFNDALEAVKKVWNTVIGFYSAIWEGIKSVFSAVVDFFKTVFTNALDGVKAVWNTVTGFFSNIWDGIKGVFKNTVSWFTTKFEGALNAVINVWNTIKGFFEDVWGWIKKPFVTAAGWFRSKFDAVVEAIKAPFEGLVDWFKQLWADIKDVFSFNDAATGLKASLEANGFPQMAGGGVLKRGQVGLLEGNGTEAVVPLENNKKWIAATAASLKSALKSEGLLSGSSSTTSSVTNNYFTQNNNSPKALSRLEIYRQSKNLLAMKGV